MLSGEGAASGAGAEMGNEVRVAERSAVLLARRLLIWGTALALGGCGLRRRSARGPRDARPPTRRRGAGGRPRRRVAGDGRGSRGLCGHGGLEERERYGEGNEPRCEHSTHCATLHTHHPRRSPTVPYIELKTFAARARYPPGLESFP